MKAKERTREVSNQGTTDWTKRYTSTKNALPE